MTDTQAVGLLLTWGGRVELDLFVEMLPQRGKRELERAPSNMFDPGYVRLFLNKIIYSSRSRLIRCDH
ncbi:hypothetical protein EJB05_25963, partial [Eragrostis curvula]